MDYKDFLKNFLVSSAIIIVCLLILVFRVFSPHHREIAILIYIVSWAIYFIPLIKKINMKRLDKNPHMKTIKKNYPTIISIIIFVASVYLMITLFPIDQIRFSQEDMNVIEANIKRDSEYVASVIDSMENSYQNLYDSGLLNLSINESNPEKVDELKEHFRIIVDHIVILEGFTEKYKYFYQINHFKYPEQNRDAFLIAYTPYIARYKILFKISKDIENNDYVEDLLNSQIDDFQQSDIYHKLKNKLNHPNSIIRLNSGRAYLAYIKISEKPSAETEELLDYSIDAYSFLFHDFDHSINMGIDSLLDNFEKYTFDSWLPVQKGIANTLGEIRLTLRHENFVKEGQIKGAMKILEPGDVIFRRKNWYASNAGLAGFWTHVTIYVGTLGTLDSYFANESYRLFNQSFSDYLLENYPQIYNDKEVLYEGYNRTTIEALGEGVVMMPLEISGDADYLGAIRPMLTKEDKLRALIFAFKNYKKAFDYDFDFNTEDSYVCSELFYKAYLKTSDKGGLNYTLTKTAGRPLISPNNIVKDFDEKYGTNQQQTDFVFFLDGNETTKNAEEKTVEEFRKTWKRPQYTFLF